MREEVIPMLASNGPPDTALTSATRWALRAERARRLAIMLSRKDAAAVEAYARECEARARDAIERPSAQRLLAA